MTLTAFISAIELGLIYTLVAYGVFLTFRIINFPDLSVDGTFPLGAAVAATFIVHEVSPLLATGSAFLAGAVAGLVTGLLHVRLRIMGILASILTMTALYSINIRIMGQPNIALINLSTIFNEQHASIYILFGIVLLVGIILFFILISQYGLGLRITGKNPRMAEAYGVNTSGVTLIVLALSNGLVALAGALFAELQGFADVSLGTGTLVAGLAAVIIGETILPSRRIYYALIACALGAMIYRLCIAFALSGNFLGMQAADLNLLTALLIAVMLCLPRVRQMLMRRGAA